MMNFTDLPSFSFDHLVPFTDQLRSAVTGHLAGSRAPPRYHTDSDLRCYLLICGRAQHPSPLGECTRTRRSPSPVRKGWPSPRPTALSRAFLRTSTPCFGLTGTQRGRGADRVRRTKSINDPGLSAAVSTTRINNTLRCMKSPAADSTSIEHSPSTPKWTVLNRTNQ